MKFPLKISFFAVIVLFFGTELMAQISDTVVTNVPQQNNEQQVAKEEKTSKAGKTTPTYYRHHKKLSATYSGYAIELVRSELPLKRSYPLFQKFGNIHYEKLDGGGYAYLLLVKFSSKKALKNYIKQMVKPKAPDARALVYKVGKRK